MKFHAVLHCQVASAAAFGLQTIRGMIISVLCVFGGGFVVWGCFLTGHLLGFGFVFSFPSPLGKGGGQEARFTSSEY